MTKIALTIAGLNSSDGAFAQAERAFAIYRYPGIRALTCMTVNNNTIGLHQVNAPMAEL